MGSSDKVESVRLWHGYAVLCGSTAFFTTLNVIISRTSTPKCVSSKVDPWRWKNILISWFHALIVGIWDVLCFVLYPELLDDLVDFNNYFIYMIVPVSAGYFIWDCCDMIVNSKILKYWEITLHHIFVLWVFLYNFHTRTCIGYVVLALMTEINSIFLHLRKLLQMCQVSFTSTLYRSIIYVNFITLLICRFPAISYILYGMHREPHRMPPIYFPFLTITMVAMAIINILLMCRLFQTDIMKNHEKQLKDKTVNGLNKTNNINLKKEN